MHRIKPEASFASGDSFVSSLCMKMTARALIGDSGVACRDNNGGLEYDGYNILRQSQSFPTELVDQIRLFSPRTWWGIMVCEDRSSFSPFDMSTILQSFVGLLLPLLVLWTIDLVRLVVLRHHTSVATVVFTGGGAPMPKVTLGRLVLVSLVSPWSIQCIYQIYRQLSILLQSLQTTLKNRSSTLTRAIDVLSKRIQNHRAYRTRRFDVYFPPSLGNSILANGRKNNDGDNTLQALLLIPGASVSHEAYSEVAARLSDNGLLVAVMSLEPLRIAHHLLGTDKASVKRIMEQITEQIRMHTATTEYWQDGDGNSNDNSKTAETEMPVRTVEWTLMGHSMGSFASMKLLDEFFDIEEDDNNKNDNDNRRKMASKSQKCLGSKGKDRNGLPEIPRFDAFLTKKLVMWGVAAFTNAATDISVYKEAKILIVQGTRDKFVEMLRYRQTEFDAFFPPNIQTKEIIGGTHEGFSSYKPAPAFADEDEDDGSGGENTKILPLDKQHEQACDATVRFLRRS
mmetsp:Transcript_13643/g.27514  ORF Transcript_13643/g.27514 Transcript_13643/m.27514 type:complete len:512 (+) Transcript_13643:71-1606(+)